MIMKKHFLFSLMAIFIITTVVVNAATAGVGKFKDYPALSQAEPDDQLFVPSDVTSPVIQQVFKKKDNGGFNFKDVISTKINQADATLKDDQVAQNSIGKNSDAIQQINQDEVVPIVTKNSASNTTTPKEVTGVYIGNQQVYENMINRNDVAAPKDTEPVQTE